MYKSPRLSTNLSSSPPPLNHACPATYLRTVLRRLLKSSTAYFYLLLFHSKSPRLGNLFWYAHSHTTYLVFISVQHDLLYSLSSMTPLSADTSPSQMLKAPIIMANSKRVAMMSTSKSSMKTSGYEFFCKSLAAITLILCSRSIQIRRSGL